MKEVEAYKLFANSPGIIHSVDYSIASERGGGSDPQSKTVYVLLPYYRRGNLQDMINANLVNHTRFPEKKLMALFLGVCRALREMHQYHGGGPPPPERMEVNGDGNGAAGGNKRGKKKDGTGKRSAQAAAGADEENEVEQQRPLMADEGLAGGSGVKSYAHRDIKPGQFSYLPIDFQGNILD